jgi:hypothetical protein
VWIALARAGDGGSVRTFGPLFPGTREQVRLRAAQMALAMLRWQLLGVNMDEILRMPGSFLQEAAPRQGGG